MDLAQILYAGSMYLDMMADKILGQSNTFFLSY